MSRRMEVAQKAVVAIVSRSQATESSVSSARRSTALTERAFRLGRGVTMASSRIAGVPVRRFTSGSWTPGVVIYLHGGAYFCGSSRLGRCYSRISADGGPDLIGVDYRLAPEHPYPAALDDALAVYRALADRPVAVFGDSAGGGLALALVQRVRDLGLPAPAALAALFPYADLTHGGSSFDSNAGRDVLTRSGLEWAAKLYLGEHDPRDPGVSPLFGTFEDFPPTLITVGRRDCLLEDSRRVAAAMRQAGVDVRLREVPDAIHGFTTLPVPEARAAIASVAGFLREHLERRDRSASPTL